MPSFVRSFVRRYYRTGIGGNKPGDQPADLHRGIDWENEKPSPTGSARALRISCEFAVGGGSTGTKVSIAPPYILMNNPG